MVGFVAPPIRNARIPVYGDPNNITEVNLLPPPGSVPGSETRTIAGVDPVPMSGLQTLGNQNVTTDAPMPVADSGSGKKTKSLNRRQAKYAEALGGKMLEQAVDTSPTTLWGGIARLGEGAMGGYMLGNITSKEQAAEDATRERMLGMLKSGKATSADWADLMTDPNSSDAVQKLAGSEIAAGLKPGTDEYQNFQQALLDPRFKQFILDTKRASATNINMPSENERKFSVLANSIKSDYQVLKRNWGSLTDQTSQIGQMIRELPLGDQPGRFMQTPQYQESVDALTNMIMMHLYATTGAAFNWTEARDKARIMMPSLTDTPEAIKSKQQRIEDMVTSIESNTGRTGASVRDQGGGGTTFNTDAEIPEGATVEDDSGQRFKKVNGQLVPVQ